MIRLGRPHAMRVARAFRTTGVQMKFSQTATKTSTSSSSAGSTGSSSKPSSSTASSPHDPISSFKRVAASMFRRRPTSKPDPNTSPSSSSSSANASGSAPLNEAFKKGSAAWHDISGTVKDTKQAILDANAYRYGGVTSKAYRDQIKQARLKSSSSSMGGEKKEVDENPDAGANVVLHKDSKWKEAWTSFRDANPVVQRIYTMRRQYDESDNPIINTTRILSERLREMFGGMLEETEHAQALAEFRMVDPTFQVDEFMKEAREFMIPEVLEGYIEWNEEVLKGWCSEAVLNVLKMSREAVESQGMSIEGKLLDLRNVELVMAKMLEETPVLLLTFKTQQIEVIRDKEGQVVKGSTDSINDVYYVWAVTRDTERLSDPITRGWKVIELAIQGVRESM